MDSIKIDILGNTEPLKKSLESAAVTATKLGAVIGAAALGSFTVAVYKGVKAAQEFDNSLVSLNVAMAASGQFTKEASQAFQDYANQIQSTTKFSDQQVLSTAALLQNMTKLTNDGVKQATQAALDLASAYNIDLDRASRLIGQAANGNVDMFRRLGIEIKKGKNDAETYANAMRALSFTQGAAEKSANTFSGAITQMKNAFGDILKNVGFFITRSPALTVAIKEITAGFVKVGKVISGERTDFFKSFLINASVIAQAGLQTAKDISDAFVLGFMRAKQAWAAFKVLTTVGLSKSFNQELMKINADIEAFKISMGQDAGGVEFFDNLIMKLQETKGVLNDLTENITNNTAAMVQETLPTMTQAWGEFFGMFQMQSQSMASSMTEAKEIIVRDFQAMGVAARNGFGNAMGSAFAAFGRALATGQNALKAFGKALLAGIGQAAIQEGTSMILRGIGYSLDPLMSGFGPPLIKAGAALAAFGGALSAVGGGGAKGGGGGGGGSVASPSNGGMSDFQDVTQLERAKQQTQITVQVQGNILDRRQTGLEIAEVIQETFGTNGIVFAT
jgi:hypothetical protein